MKVKLKRILGGIVCIAILIGINLRQGRSLTETLKFSGLVFIGILIFNLVLSFLEKKGFIDLKKEEEQRNEFGLKLKKNKKAQLWLVSALFGFMISFMGPIYLFTTPEPNNPHIWTMNNELTIKYYWLFALSFYTTFIFLFLWGKKSLTNENKKRIGHYLASIFTFSIFSSYLVGARDQPNLILAMFCLCMSVSWVQFISIKIYNLLEEDRVKEKTLEENSNTSR